MIYRTAELKVHYEKAGLSEEGCRAELQCYAADISEEIGPKRKPAVLICPGGGYDYISDREGEPIAFALLAKGIQCFVLKYTVQRAFPVNLLEAASAVAYIRKHAAEFDIDPDKIFCMGFSAGGHLAASLAVHWNRTFVKDTLGFTEEHKPNGSLLCYPVISASDTHQGSVDNLCRDNFSEGFRKTFSIEKEAFTDLISLEKSVDKDTPRTFLWHCADDGCVPASNSLRYAASLNALGIPYELHVYPEGGHGLALANEVTANTAVQIQKDCEDWIRLAVNWIYNQ